MIGLYIFLGLIAVGFFLMLATQAQVSKKRRAGLYPAEGQATMADVERLARAGEKIMAIRCYREIHGVGLAEAKQAVEKING